MKNHIIIATSENFREILSVTVEEILARRIPQIMRQANRKEYLTTSELEELTGMTSRTQKYHRDAGNLEFSQEGRRILYKTDDIEAFILDRRVTRKVGV
ncbi:MAG: helix-turn-helix domain-containing protein [Balneolaceae bacterium]